MTALGEKDDVVTLSTLAEPLTKDTFAASDLRWDPVRIYTGSIVNSCLLYTSDAADEL